jgi:hypothetical protein
MALDERLRERLAKLEALFARAGTAGEQAAAGAAIERLQGRVGPQPEQETETELKFSLPDLWSVRLFVAVCRKHGVRPYRYPRQRRTTVMVRVHERTFDRVVWPEFSHLQTALELYFEETVDHLITEAMRSDGDDSKLEAAMIRG